MKHDANPLSPKPLIPTPITQQPPGRFRRKLNPQFDEFNSLTAHTVVAAPHPPPRSHLAANQTTVVARINCLPDDEGEDDDDDAGTLSSLKNTAWTEHHRVL
jgi:hypothetical protein